MNKKTKKLLVSLLSVLMVLSFMPTMAFAKTDEPVTGGHSWEGTYYVDADEEGLKVIVAPTCTEDGIGQIPCTEELNGEACGALRTVWINATGHSRHALSNKVRVTAEQMMDKFGYTQEQKDAFYNSPYEFCEANIYECADCGMYLTASGKTITSMYDDDFSSRYKTKHTAPAGLKDCAASFKCTVCGIEGRTNDDYNAETSAAAHADTDNLTHEVKKYHMKDTTGDGEADEYVEVVTDTCKLCGVVVNREATPVPSDKPMPSYAHTAGAWETELEPTCTVPGKQIKKCTECGEPTGDQKEIAPLGHDYKTITFTGEDNVIYSQSMCTRCGDLKDDRTPIGFVPPTPESSYKYSYEKVVDANCEQGAWIKVTVTLDGKVVEEWYEDDLDIEGYIEDGDIILINGKYYDKYNQTEIPYVKALGHEFGEMKQVAEATCTERAIEAQVCSKCGKVNHKTQKTIGKALGHDVKEQVVPATCGEAGYSYKICARCNKYLDKAGENASDEMIKYDETKPVVALGEKCTFDTWKVIKEATADEDGSKILVCSKCGAELAGSETVIPADTNAKKDQEIEAAKTTIEEAAKIVGDDTYTADSIKAITEAQAALNQAIASGTAADVKRAKENLEAAVSAAQKKAESTLSAKGKTVKAKSNKVTKIKAKKAFTVKNAAGKVTYKKTKGNAKVKVSKAGKVTVKKGLKKGKTYKIKVKITDAGSDTVLGAAKTVTLKVKITK
ncbi:MAG: hypothetical protein IKF07_05445 [Eubacterium sp.]|nr:hypothetical protein [Eubacterium sp.]